MSNITILRDLITLNGSLENFKSASEVNSSLVERFEITTEVL